MADRVAVMYMGRIMETGSTDALLDRPAHPYTRALLSAVPLAGGPRLKRAPLAGSVPSTSAPPAGCLFHTRCAHAKPECRAAVPPLTPAGAGHSAACIRLGEI
jgi:oligopeptide/dipeptide ABC transporter ATP-binding protein